MEIRENIANTVNRILQERNKTITELSADIDIPRSSLENYSKGVSNLRADTIELLADKLGLTPAELVSDLSETPEWMQAKMVLFAAHDISGLSPEKQESGIHAFLQLVSIFSAEEIDHYE